MTGDAITVFDLVLAPSILILALVLLNIRDIFASVVLFILFGLLMSMTWARLDAVDIALAEAAIGAGITGALLLNALGDVRARGSDPPEGFTRGPSWRSLLVAFALVPVALILGYAVVSAPSHLDEMRPLVEASLKAAEAPHDVTAVLLAFRGYDTLLELTVLFLVVVGAWALRLSPAPGDTPPLGVVLEAAGRLVVPMAILIGGYLLWRGSHAPGGAFQGGAVLAGAAVLLQLGARSAWPRVLEPLASLALGLAVMLFAAVGLVSTIAGRPFLFYRGTWAEVLIPLVETAATISIAMALVAIFMGRAHREASEEA